MYCLCDVYRSSLKFLKQKLEVERTNVIKANVCMESVFSLLKLVSKFLEKLLAVSNPI